MNQAEILTLVGTATAVLLAIIAAARQVGGALKGLKRDLADNTRKTVAAGNKAEAAETAAQAIQLTQVNLGELDTLRRWKAAFDTLPECVACKEAVETMVDRRRVRPMTPRVVPAPSIPRRVAGEDLDDPTGFDAGRSPHD